jgi:aconitate hydratase
MLPRVCSRRTRVEAGLQTKPWVKTSLAPGSRVVTDYLDRAGLTPYLEKLGFALVGYGCTTCIGNSGPLPDEVGARSTRSDLNVVAVLSGNRNFEGRIHPAGPRELPGLAAALRRVRAWRARRHRPHDGADRERRDGPVYLATSGQRRRGRASDRDVTQRTVRARVRTHLGRRRALGALPVADGPMYDWDPASTYVQEPPFFEGSTTPSSAGTSRARASW